MTRDPDLWEVTGVQAGPDGQQKHFKYWTKNVVLATGSYDKPNALDKPGENLDFVVHSLKEMELKMINAPEKYSVTQPIVIVGAGLSAADAVLAALHQGLSVIHVFRRNTEDQRLVKAGT